MILVTGATGFLGRNLIPRLCQAGYRVRALVRPTSETGFLRRLGIELAFVSDIADEPGVRQACRGCRFVVHAASHFRFWGSLPLFWQTNVEGTAAILAAAAACAVERVVHVSTVAIVGQTIPGRVIDESHPCRPQDFYQRTKLEGELLARAVYRERRLPVIVLRPGAYYGPWGRYAFNRLFFEEPLRGWRIRVNRGRYKTFPVYVADVAEAIIQALSRGRPGQIYNVSGQSLDHNSINAAISDLAGISRWRFDLPVPLVLAVARLWTALSRYTGREPFYPIDMKSYVLQDWIVSSDKARSELGFVPTPFAEGARQTLEWYWQHGLLKSR